nr:hypothetical protein StreXyl84_59710 [Streptomyces sp. Xyl84]
MPKTTVHDPRPTRTAPSPRRFGRRSRLAPRTGAALAGAVALLGLASALPASAAQSTGPARNPQSTQPARSGEPVRTGRASQDLPAGFGDCPALPAGVDPAAWRCEVHTASPRLAMGSLAVTLAPITMTHAEGPLPDGSPGQVWGAMHSAATPVPGGPTGSAAAGRTPLLGLAIHPEYGGRADFYTGRFSLRFRLTGPLVPRDCAIGADEPVDFALKRPSPSEWISTDPPLIRFSAYDDTFAAPAAEHCGPLTKALDRRLALPAPSGNLMSYDATYTFRTYDRLPAR